MKVARQDLLTPANALTLLGFVLCGFGSWNLNSLLGVWLLGIGRLLDMVDGTVARRTHASAFGALLDASTDKFIALFILIASWHYHTMPLGILLFIFGRNVLSVFNYFYVSHLNLPPEPSLAGKRAGFAEGIVFVSFALAHLSGASNLWHILGWAVFVLHLPLALQASAGYAKIALSERAKRKAKRH